MEDLVIRKISALGAALALPFATPVAAQTVNFNGTATAACTLSAATDGVISLSSDLKSWGTTTPGAITATNNADSDLTVTRGSAWSVSPNTTPATTFGHTVSVTGGNTVSDGQFNASGNAKTGRLQSPGVNLVSISVSASAASAYRPGTYQFAATVTCVPR